MIFQTIKAAAFILFLSLAVFLSFACSGQTTLNSTLQNALPEPKAAPEKYQDLIKKLEPFFEPMKPPQPDEWLATFKENGQTFVEYINQNPTLPTAERKYLYVLPLGQFNRKQLNIIKEAAEYLGIFFGLPVKILRVQKYNKPLRLKDARNNPFTGQEQIRTGYILNEILPSQVPADAAALIAFTNEDLYPDQTFNYVFGQATFENRVGVWSLYRLNDEKNDDKFLRRTIKIAAHETGHMFSIQHCVKYECLMSGTNHLGETDKRPIDACPECTSKILWMNNADPVERYKKLAFFARKNGFAKETDEFVKKAEAVK